MPNYLDIFAGAGGLSEGFIRAGFSPIAHIEMDSAACYTLKTRSADKWLKSNKNLEIYNDYLNGKICRSVFYNNIAKSVLNYILEIEISKESLSYIFQTIREKLSGKKLDLIIGGPPCQAYSLAGRSRSKTKMIGDKRNYLYILYAEFLKEFKPQYFVFENVTGLLSAKDEDGTLYLDSMLSLFSECGYNTEFHILNAMDYNVLQNRKRIILVGSLNKKSNFYPNLEKLKSNYIVYDLLNDLPPIKAGEGCFGPIRTIHTCSQYLFEAKIKEYEYQPVTLHIARPNNETDLKIYKIVVENWNETQTRINYTHLPLNLQKHKNKKSFTDRFKIVAGNLPYSQTIVAHICKDGHYFIHPDINQNRSLTPREAARLQTFPDDYYFESKTGKPSRTTAFKQIGNAVPVLLAEKIATKMIKLF